MDNPVISELAKLLTERGLTLATAESCTGGTIASALTHCPGASTFFRGSVVAYQNDIKIRLLGVSQADIESHTVVSEPVARSMAVGVCRLLDANIGIATTGIAGPSGGSDQVPVGTVWIALVIGEDTFAHCLHLSGTREEVMAQATDQALLTIFDLCKNKL